MISHKERSSGGVELGRSGWGIGQPLSRRRGVRTIKITDCRFRERHAKFSQPLLPMLVSDSSAPFDVFKVFHIECHLRPQRTGIPAVEISHIEQHPQLSVLPHETLELRDKVIVIRAYEFPANMNEANLVHVFFVDLNWHFYSFR